MLANLRTSGPPDDEVAAGTTLAGAGAVPAGVSDLALARGALEGGIAQPGKHEVSHRAKQRDEEIAADPMGGNQSRTALCVSHPGRRL